MQRRAVTRHEKHQECRVLQPRDASDSTVSETGALRCRLTKWKDNVTDELVDLSES
jgi:hypothetical protein